MISKERWLGLAAVVVLGTFAALNLGGGRRVIGQEGGQTPQPEEAVTVQTSSMLGKSQPLVDVVTDDAAVEAEVLPDADAESQAAADVVDAELSGEHSLLVASWVDLSPRVDESADEFGVSSPLDVQGETQRERERARGGEQEVDDEEAEREMAEGDSEEEAEERAFAASQNAQPQPDDPYRMATSPGSAAVEQTKMGTKDAAELIASFDGMGAGFKGPQGGFRGGNPSDNSLAVGPDHIVQVVNSRMAVFTKKGKKYNETGRVLYGPVNTGNVFKGCGGCDRNNGDAVVRYDQLADRWLIVMPLFNRLPATEDEPPTPRSGEPARWSKIGREGQPGPAEALFQPPPPDEAVEGDAAPRRGRGAGAGGQRRGRGAGPQGSYAMCYAISTTSDPLGSYYRYHFVRPLFPDYPRPAVWPDGYYVPSSTGDTVIQKHACVVERDKMLKGEPAREQCVIIDDVNFLNNSDVDGTALPPPGAPNIMMAAGGTQLKKNLKDDGIYYWKFHVDWNDPSKTKAEGPVKIDVAPYNYLCGGQLTRCVTQPGTDTTLDSQGDKIMQRLVYRRIGDRESIVAVHSINTTAAGGGVRWYEFRVDGKDRDVKLYQQGTYAPEGNFRWMASPAMDKSGNIGIGYSFGGVPNFPGQRFTGRLDGDPLGQMTLKETVLVEGEASQARGNRWQDYVQAAVDPDDDCTIWYVGDYVKDGQTGYSTKIGGFRMPGCAGGG